MKYRDDIDPETTWVVSDTHFGHDNIVGFFLRPDDHEQAIIAEWRAAVPDDATVLHLGDLAYRSNARFKHIVSKELTGARKLLIKGNHDGQRYSFYRDSGFRFVQPFAIMYDGFTVSFSHYPWNRESEGAMPLWTFRVHGHIHNNGYTREAFVPFLKNHINLSVEQTHYRPVNLKLLLDAALFGEYPETKQSTIDQARAEKIARTNETSSS